MESEKLKKNVGGNLSFLNQLTMKNNNFSVIESGDMLNELSLSMVLGGAIENETLDMDCDHCNTCGNGGNNSNNTTKEEAHVNIG